VVQVRRADRHRRMRGLMRIDPDHHCRHRITSLPWLRAGPWRARLIPGPLRHSPLLSHATARPRPAGTSFVSQPRKRGGRRLESHASRDLSTVRPSSLPSRPGTIPSTQSLN
jgi:hypothetical protein